jgi:calcium/proton exchanger cax
MFDTTEPVNDPRTTSGNEPATANSAMISSGALPKLAFTSSMQVAVFVTPAVCLLSWIVGRGLPLSFRVVEVATMAAAALFAAIVVADGKSRRWEGFLLIGVYAAAVVWYLLA